MGLSGLSDLHLSMSAPQGLCGGSAVLHMFCSQHHLPPNPKAPPFPPPLCLPCSQSVLPLSVWFGRGKGRGNVFLCLYVGVRISVCMCGVHPLVESTGVDTGVLD